MTAEIKHSRFCSWFPVRRAFPIATLLAGGSAHKLGVHKYRPPTEFDSQLEK